MSDTEFRRQGGAAWLDLQQTVTGRRRAPRIERLTSPARLREWLSAAGLAPHRAPTGADLAAALELREALYALARAAVDGGRPDGASIEVVNRVLAHDAAPELRASPDGFRASPPATTREALGRIARQAVEQLTGPERARLRACGDPTCAGIFLDDTGRRRWCSGARCGSRVRVRAHRARAAGGADRPGAAH